ncbi:unnamed protein product, partial [Ectocarpus sp. 12 AP-2014]
GTTAAANIFFSLQHLVRELTTVGTQVCGGIYIFDVWDQRHFPGRSRTYLPALFFELLLRGCEGFVNGRNIRTCTVDVTEVEDVQDEKKSGRRANFAASRCFLIGNDGPDCSNFSVGR